jgi:3D (Asp-Asp-Asp) domain-containing protein
VRATSAIFRFFLASFFPVWVLIATSCSTLKIPDEKQHTLLVTATAFNSLSKQGQGNPNVGAWGDRITPGMNAIAVSADLVSLGLTRGTRVRIKGLRNDYVVLDRMPPKWKKRIDIYMGNDVKAARSWGRREVTIYWEVPDESQPSW